MGIRHENTTRGKVATMAASNAGAITNKDLVLFALYEVGGAERPVHTEIGRAHV